MLSTQSLNLFVYRLYVVIDLSLVFKTLNQRRRNHLIHRTIFTVRLCKRLVMVFCLRKFNMVLAEKLSIVATSGVAVMWVMAVMMAMRLPREDGWVIIEKEVACVRFGQLAFEFFDFALDFVAEVEILLLNFLAFIHYKSVVSSSIFASILFFLCIKVLKWIESTYK